MGSQEEILYREIWRQKVDREHDLAADGDLRTVAALQMIDRGNRLLDVGCGEGTLAYRLREQFREVHGIDISKEAIRFAREKGIKGRVLNINEEPLPYPDRTFDTVTSLDVIEHVFDPIRFVKEIHRVLTPGTRRPVDTQHSKNSTYRLADCGAFSQNFVRSRWLRRWPPALFHFKRYEEPNGAAWICRDAHRRHLWRPKDMEIPAGCLPPGTEI